jgi:6-phosphogluconolactonase
LFDHIPIPPGQIHAPDTSLDPAEMAAVYQTVLAQVFSVQPPIPQPSDPLDQTTQLPAFPQFDLILLGMGEDGHTASLFPGTAALAERAAWVVMNEVPQLHTRRMTLTYPVLNAADRVWVTIAGAGKRAVVAECLAAAARGETPRPILGVRPTAGELIWFLDKAAAGPTA